MMLNAFLPILSHRRGKNNPQFEERKWKWGKQESGRESGGFDRTGGACYTLSIEKREVFGLLPKGFVYLDEAVPGVLWDAKYAGCDNFVGEPVDGYRTGRVVGTEELATALRQAYELAKEAGCGLMLWDAYRPQQAVDHFIRFCAAPETGKTKEKHYPNVDKAQLIPLGYIAARSGHSRGSTIDLTLTDAQGKLLDMGGIFDYMDERSHHGCPDISKEQADNRALLRDIMLRCGFTDYKNEWWHYRLRNEPYPDTYFDFPIE